MRDYTSIPKYAGITKPSARYNYLHDLLEEYQGRDPGPQAPVWSCSRRAALPKNDCRYCTLSGFLGGDPEICCNWRAEADPDRAISILESLLEKTGQIKSVPLSREEKIQYIADHYGLAAQLAQTREECAELIVATSKFDRAKTDAERRQARDHVTEEMADVAIMLRQLRYLLDNNTALQLLTEQKLNRQIQRIREEGGSDAQD